MNETSEALNPAPQRILVPMDFSEAARAALQTALRLARPPQDVVHLFYTPGFYARTAEETALENRNPFGSRAQLAGNRFHAWAEACGSGAIVKVLPVTGTPDARNIAQTAVRMGSTLLVLARRTYTLWERIWDGCPAERLRRLAPCPVRFVTGPAGPSPVETTA